MSKETLEGRYSPVKGRYISHLDRRTPEPEGCLEPAEAAADDNHPVCARLTHR